MLHPTLTWAPVPTRTLVVSWEPAATTTPAPSATSPPRVAAGWTRAGAAVRVKFSRVRAEALREAIHQVLTDADLRAAARRISTSFAAAGGAPAAASALEALVP